MGLADRANPYVEEQAPWTLKKDPAQARRLQDVCTVALNLFRQIMVYLSPVLPRLAKQAGELLNDPIERWDQAQTPLVGTKGMRPNETVGETTTMDESYTCEFAVAPTLIASGAVAGEPAVPSPKKSRSFPAEMIGTTPALTTFRTVSIIASVRGSA